MRFVCVLHQDKVNGLGATPRALAANPTCSVKGMLKAHDLVPIMRTLGPFYEMCYCSRLARASDTASVLCAALDIDFQSLSGLSQYSYKDGNVTICYPGYGGHENFVTWQKSAFEALRWIYYYASFPSPMTKSVLIVAHRPTIAGLVAHARGVHDEDGIETICLELTVTGQSYIQFDLDDLGQLTMV